MLSFRIRAHHAERALRRELLVAGARRQHDHIARLRRHRDAGVAAELDRHLAAVDPEHLMAVAVEMMVRVHPVAPRGRPAVERKNLLEFLRRGVGHRARIDQQRPARMIRDRSVRREQVRDDVHSAPATAAPKAWVPSLPPRSAVRVCGFSRTRSTAREIAAPASLAATDLRFVPIHSSSMAAERMSEVGFARSSPASTEPARPRLPESSEARSDRMSAYILVESTTS